MKIGIDWTQNSTWRGAVWLVVGVVGIAMSWGSNNIDALLSVGAAVAGGIGVGVKD